MVQRVSSLGKASRLALRAPPARRAPGTNPVLSLRRPCLPSPHSSGALLTTPLSHAQSHRKSGYPPVTKPTTPLRKGQALGGLVLGVTGRERAKAFPVAFKGESGCGPPPVPTLGKSEEGRCHRAT